MNQEDIRDAITLFQYSKTATMGRGPSVLATLQNLFKQGEVGFHKMRRKTLRGQYLKDRDGYDLRVNPEFLMLWASPPGSIEAAGPIADAADHLSFVGAAQP
jgi:hypothetical protein